MEKKVQTSFSYLLREARPHWMLCVAKRGALKHGCGEFQHFPKKLVKLGKHHDSTWVWDLWENICRAANVTVLTICHENTCTFKLNKSCICVRTVPPCVQIQQLHKEINSQQGQRKHGIYSQLWAENEMSNSQIYTHSVVYPLFSLHTLLPALLSLRKLSTSHGFHCSDEKTALVHWSEIIWELYG